MKTPLFPRINLKLSGTRRTALDQAHGRLVLVGVFFVVCYIFVAARLFDLSFIQGDLQRYTASGEPVAAAAEEHEKMRADIVDRNGVLLATSLATASLYADPHLIPEPEKTAAGLVKIFPDLAYGDVLQKLQRRVRFVWIRRNLTPREQYAVLNLGQPGLSFKKEMHRIYPQGPLAAHMAGYVDIDGRGLAGVERSFDRLLQDGGEALHLTIDIRLQHILRRETMKAMKDFSGAGAAGVILDMSNGDVLAAVSLPDFDPNNPGASATEALFNRTTLGVYELGSTFKLFSTAALLETKNAPMSEVFDAREPLKRGRFTISDFHPEKRMLTIPEVFMYSSNIGAALMGEEMGTATLKAFYKNLGFLEPLKLEIEEIGKPLYPDPWRDINTLTAAYGHGIAVSPLQMVAAASSIVGGGTLVSPHLVLDETESTASPGNKKKSEVHIVSAKTAHRMRQLLRLVVREGTGTQADVPGYRVGGKTGTSEKTEKGGYNARRLLSSFLGFFPMEAPRYAVFVMVDEPHANKSSYGYATGGWVAAPAVGRTIAAMASVLGLPPVDVKAEQDMAASLRQYVHKDNEDTAGGTLAAY